MQKRKNFLPAFLTFFVIALILFILSLFGYLNGLVGILEQGSVPLQRAVFGLVRFGSDDTSEVAKLREENRKLSAKLVEDQKQQQEMQALSDQFQASKISSQKLETTHVIGITEDRATLDKGAVDGLRVGQAVIVQDDLVGKIERVSTHLSILDLVTNKNISFTAKKMNTGPIGVVTGSTDGVILDNVVSSEKLAIGDLILTKGDVNGNGVGLPPDLIVGKVATVRKRASNLFQTAEVKSLVDFTRLNTVFVLISN